MTETDKLKCAERELKYRQWVYPTRIADGKMTQEQADHEIACMRAIVSDYDKIVNGERLL